MLGLKSSRAASAKADAQMKSFDDFSVTLGDVMRGERATMGKSLMDVQRELKIKAAYIAAVEDADPSVFDTPGFIAGYVRSYAKYLELDPEWAFDKFCAESGFATIHGMSERALPARMSREERMAAIGTGRADPLQKSATPFVPPTESMWSKFNAKAIGSSLILIALIASLGYGAYSVINEIQRVQVAPSEGAPFAASDIDPLAPRATQLNSGETPLAEEPPAIVPNEQAENLDRLYRPVPLAAPQIEPRDGPIANLDPNSQGAFVPPALPVLPFESGDPSQAFGDDVIVAAESVLPAEEPPVKEVAFFSTDDVWLRVLNADGSTLYEETIPAGAKYVIPAVDDGQQTAVVERAGNSGALYFQVNGAVYGPAGESGSLVKGIDLSEEALVERFAAIPVEEQGDALKLALESIAPDPASEEPAPAE